MSIIIPANSAVSGGFEVANSLMFNPASSAYLQKSASAGTNTKATFSAWIKKSDPTTEQFLFYHFGSSANNFRIRFDPNTIGVQTLSGSSTVMHLNTSAKFRDPSAWMNIVVAIDSTQGTASDRAKIYVNGVQETSLSASTYPSQNQNMHFNESGTVYIGSQAGSNYFNGYMSEVVWIDGTALAPTSFGEFDEDSGIWVPIDVSGLTFGNNGSYLDFQDSANLGNDANGGTDFTETNIDAADQATDTCTNNFATFNPLRLNNLSQTYSKGNTFLIRTGSAGQMNGTQGVKSGKWYYECLIDDYWQYFGWTVPSLNTTLAAPCSDSGSGFYGLYSNASAVLTYANGSQTSQGSYTAMASGQIWGIAFDADNAKMYFSVNGVWENSSDPANQTNPAMSSIPVTDFLVPAIGQGTGSRSSTIKMNFGSPYYAITSGNADANGYGDFEYTVPSGYFAINSKNLAEYG